MHKTKSPYCNCVVIEIVSATLDQTEYLNNSWWIGSDLSIIIMVMTIILPIKEERLF